MTIPALLVAGAAVSGQIIPTSSAAAYLSSQPVPSDRPQRAAADGPRGDALGTVALGLILILTLMLGWAGARRREETP